MTRQFHASRLNMQAFAQQGASLAETTPLSDLQRIAHEAVLPEPDLSVQWQAAGEMRGASRPSGVAGVVGSADEVWLHLQAKTTIPLTCQRCMAAVHTELDVDRWFRFVASEEIAMAEDDESEEDLLVMEPQFDLLAVLEDELLMALPLVPMHATCPQAPVLSTGEKEISETAEVAEKPNPFAVLAQLKAKK